MYSNEVSFGPLQRNAVVGKAMAMTTLFGLPSQFITAAPADHEQVGSFLLTGPRPNGEGVMELSIPLSQDSHLRLKKHVLLHPATAARTFERLVQAFIHHLVGLDPGQRQSAGTSRGIFGPAYAILLANEGQGRGSLHFHAPTWCGLSPELVSRCSDDDRLLAEVARVLDSIVTTYIPDEIRSMRDREELNQRLAAMPCPVESIASIMDRGAKVAATRNEHVHKSTCHKGRGWRLKCRFCLPAAVQDSTAPHFLAKVGRQVLEISRPLPAPGLHEGVHVIDQRVIAWELRRRKEDTCIATFCPALSAALGSNATLSPLFNREGALAALHYITPYITKDVVAPANVSPLVRSGIEKAALYPSTASDVVENEDRRDCLHLLNKILNTVSSVFEVSAQIAAFSLIEREPWQTSCGFW